MSSGLRFGIVTDQNLPYRTLVERWQRFEDLGFDSVWDCDHFNQPSQPSGPYFEGWTLLAALASVTVRIRIGVLVSSNTFRHPSLLAHQAITVDHVSGGRLEVGLGAGWFEEEHSRLGVPFPTAGERVHRFEEAVRIVDGLLRRESTSLAGRYWQLHEAYLRPRPIQDPRPPLILAAHQSRMLRVCARYADTWNSFGTVEEMAQRNRILDRHCLELGRDPSQIRRSLYGWASQMERQGMPDPWQSVESFHEVVGRYREVGINEFLFDAPEEMGILERIATEVIPRLREA